MLRSAVSRGVFATQAAKRMTATKSPLPVMRVVFASGAKSPFLKSMQVHAFASVPTKDEDKEAASPAKTFEELLKENEELRKEVADLKEKVKNKPGKFMAVISQFGLPFVVWWTTLYIGTGVGLYVAFDTGLIAGSDAIDFIMSMGLDKFIDPQNLDPKYGNMALAVVLNECIEPIRFPIALATIPTVKRIFSKDKPAEVEQ
ncbi:hypothetical protein FI667_g2589, partial [Globisporangium splendens]